MNMKWKLLTGVVIGAITTTAAFASNATQLAVAMIANEGQKQAAVTTSSMFSGMNIVYIAAGAALIIWYLNKNK